MKKIWNLFFFIFISCNSQYEKQISLLIKNHSSEKIDSLEVRFFNKAQIIKKIHNNEQLNLTFKIKNNEIPEGETGVFYITIYKNDYFIGQNVGFIGFPYTKLEDNYSFFIYDNYIAIKEGFIPKTMPEKRNIIEYKNLLKKYKKYQKNPKSK